MSADTVQGGSSGSGGSAGIIGVVSWYNKSHPTYLTECPQNPTSVMMLTRGILFSRASHGKSPVVHKNAEPGEAGYAVT